MVEIIKKAHFLSHHYTYLNINWQNGNEIYSKRSDTIASLYYN